MIIEKTNLPFGALSIDASTLDYRMLRLRKVLKYQFFELLFFHIIFYPRLSAFKSLFCGVGDEHSGFKEDWMNEF